MISFGFISAASIASRLAPSIKVMVNLETSKKIGLNLYQAGKRLILSSIHNEDPKREAQTASSTEYLIHNWLEAVFSWTQMVILWHDPFVSLCAITGVLSSFLLFTYFAPRFYATILFLLFAHNLVKVWFKHVWPEIRVPPEADHEEGSRLDIDRWAHLNLMTLEELRLHIKNFLKTTYIGSQISDLTLIISLITLLLTVPGIYLHLLPDKAKEYVKKKVISLSAKYGSSPELLNTESQVTSTTSEQTSKSIFEQLKTGILGNQPKPSSEIEYPNLSMTGLAVPTSQSNEMEYGAREDSNLIDLNSSLESASLDPDDEQHDGFVLL